jgi:hypothetical protein
VQLAVNAWNRLDDHRHRRTVPVTVRRWWLLMARSGVLAEIATTDADRRGLPELKPCSKASHDRRKPFGSGQYLRRRAQPDGARELDNQ